MSKKARKMVVHVMADLSKTNSISAIHSKTLERRYGISGAEIRSIIHQLRKEGKPVCSGSNGYFMPEGLIEARHTINHLRSRANSILEIARSIEDSFTKEDQQVLL